MDCNDCKISKNGFSKNGPKICMKNMEKYTRLENCLNNTWCKYNFMVYNDVYTI